MKKAKHRLGFVVGSLVPMILLPGVPGATDNPFQANDLTHGFMTGREGTEMLAQGYCGAGMRGWDGACGGMMHCGGGMQGMRGWMMGGGMMCGGMMGGGMGMMRMMDADGDGKISKEEMTKHQEWMMKALDANEDGQIEASEMMGRGMGRMR